MHVAAEPLDKPGFVRSVDAIGLCACKRFLDKFCRKRLRRLRQHDALARDSPMIESDILRQARALHFLDGVHRGNAQNRGLATAGFFNHAGDLFARDERAHRVMDQDDLRIV